jgi:hypothetical protein
MQSSVNSKILVILMLTIYASIALAASNKAEYSYNPKPIRIVNGYRESPPVVEEEKVDLLFENKTFDFNLFPNPAANSVQLQFDVELPTQIEITDLTGKVIYSKNASTKLVSINLNEIANGYYLVKAMNGIYQNKTKQLIIAK